LINSERMTGAAETISPEMERCVRDEVIDSVTCLSCHERVIYGNKLKECYFFNNPYIII
jgi:hypothetical protein